jgi:hypothetical protein
MESSEMFRQKTVLYLAIATLLTLVIACSSRPEPTTTPVPQTVIPTPVTVAPIEIDPITDLVGFLRTLPSTEVACATNALGGSDPVLAITSSSIGDNRLTLAQTDALDSCLSERTVNGIFISHLYREAGTLSDDTITCIGEQIGGISVAGLFLEEPAADVIINSLKYVFCLASDERARISASETFYGFGELGGIDALECVVNGVGPTGLTDLVDIYSGQEYDFEDLGELLPLMIECGAIGNDEFEELGVSADQVGCVLTALGEDGLALLDPTAAEPDLSNINALVGTLSYCGIELENLFEGSDLPIDQDVAIDPVILPTVQAESLEDIKLPLIELEDLLEGSDLPIDPDVAIDPVILPTVLAELPEDIDDMDLPFTEEQIACLTSEIGEDQIANLLAGGGADLSLFSALSKCQVDLSVLLGG